MFQIGDYVVYQNEVCIIKAIKEKYFHGKDYYVLNPSLDTSLTINVPVDEEKCLLKPVMTRQEAEAFIKKIPSIEPITLNDKMIENEYKALLKTEDKSDLVRIIKTTYLRNHKRLLSGKNIGEKDEMYFEKAEKLLYSELAASLNLTYDETKQHIMDVVNSL